MGIICIVLLGMNVVLLVVAILRGNATIRDSAASVTTGNVIAVGIVVTLLAVLAVPLARLPLDVQRHAQAFALAAQALHATGHLAGLYYSIQHYDDALHAALTAWAALVALSVARAARLIPKKHVTPIRAAIIVAFAGVALAGVWEIFEYTSDSLLASREQDNLDDTMADMAFGGVGTLLAAAWAHRAIQREHSATRRESHAKGAPP